MHSSRNAFATSAVKVDEALAFPPYLQGHSTGLRGCNGGGVAGHACSGGVPAFSRVTVVFFGFACRSSWKAVDLFVLFCLLFDVFFCFVRVLCLFFFFCVFNVSFFVRFVCFSVFFCLMSFFVRFVYLFLFSYLMFFVWFVFFCLFFSV